MRAKEEYGLKSTYQDLPRGRKFPKSKRFPYPAFLFLCSYPRLECKDTQIRREEGEERKEGWMEEEIQFSYGNLVRLSLEAEGSEKSLFPFLPRFALMDVTMASKSSPAISPPSTLVHGDGKA